MTHAAAFTPVKILSYVVLLTMFGSFVYVMYIALTHWTGIGV